jgi:hypothetical protein
MQTAREALITPLPSLVTRSDQGLTVACRTPSNTWSPGRVLWLSGTWTAPGDSFSLEAILAVAATRVDGPIHWTSNRRPPLSGVEIVRGTFRTMSLELRGISAGRGLACDQYRIALSGDGRRGTFTGTSWTFGRWNGRLNGAYLFGGEESAS